VDVELAHYGPGPLTNAKPMWKIVDLDGKVAAHGEFPPKDIPIGKSIPLGKVSVDLSKLEAPRQYKLIVGLDGTNFENDWNFWLYPAKAPSPAPADVTVTRDWKEATAKLASGGKVLFVPTANLVDNTSPPLDSVPVFWNRLMNPKLSAMMGLLIDPKHPALAEFPSQTWCDWEWTELVRNVRAINVEKAPKELQPIVQAIDDWNRNYKLGVIFEATVGKGRLMVSAIDVQNESDNRLGALQLRRSLLAYMGSDKFQPQVAMTPEQADALWPGPSATGPTSAPAPQALPGDIVDLPSTTRPGR
jgi:hypothetical protein